MLERYKYVLGVASIVLLLPSLPGLGREVNGVQLWVKAGLQFQPGELAKIFLIVFLAAYLRDKRGLAHRAGSRTSAAARDLGRGDARARPDERPRLRAPHLRDLSRDAVRGDGPRALRRRPALFIAGAGALYNALTACRSACSSGSSPGRTSASCTLTGQLDFRQNCDSYQLVKSLYSIANGGYGGTGLGRGTFTTVDGVDLIPHLNTDFIYSALAQELGLIGAAALLCLYMVFVARGMRVALIAQDGFSKLLAAGLTFGFALQTFIIVGGVLRVVPLTGITLPFISYGGSSILANFVMLALLLLVSNRANATGGGR